MMDSKRKLRGAKRLWLNDPKNWREKDRTLTPSEINLAKRVRDAARPS